MDTNPVRKLSAKDQDVKAHQQISQLRGQLATLRLENEKLKEHSTMVLVDVTYIEGA